MKTACIRILLAVVILFIFGCKRSAEEPAAEEKEAREKTTVVAKEGEKKMDIEKQVFGKADDKDVYLYTLTNANGLQAKITNYGGIITHLIVPDRDGNLGDIVLGYDTLDEYIKNNPYFGALIGRYGNRIGKGKFNLEGKEYSLATNNGPNHLHGGNKGFDKVVWDAEPMKTGEGPALKLTYLSSLSFVRV